MPKRIFFTQQRPFDYQSLRAGLGLITPEELEIYNHTTYTCPNCQHEARQHTSAKCGATDCRCGWADSYSLLQLCPKIYTTRTRPLSGEYVVVEGSRYHARPVTPKIEFRVDWSRLAYLTMPAPKLPIWQLYTGEWQPIPDSFPSDDLGIAKSSFSDLRRVLRELNNKSTHMRWYINKLVPLEVQ